jgi:hypothetical protein
LEEAQAHITEVVEAVDIPNQHQLLDYLLMGLLMYLLEQEV